MIGKLIATASIIGVIIIGMSIYLAPNDLADCKEVEATGTCVASDAIVVVSGGDTAARTDEAIRLFQAGWAPTIIFSGAAADKDGPSNALVMQEQAITKGVPRDATIIEDTSETTKQNAEKVKQYLEQKQTKRIVLVTSGYHMRRTSLEFSRQLGSGVTIVRHPVSSDSQWGPFWWLTPWGWWLSLSELIKIGVFYIGGTR